MTYTIMVITAAILITFICASVCTLIYVAIFHITKIEASLANCKFIQGNKRVYSRAGMLGNAMRLSMIAGMLTTPNFYIHRGLADADQIKNFPYPMKILLRTTWICLGLSFCALIILHIADRLLRLT